MKKLLLFILSISFAAILFGQAKEKQLYSYLQQKILKDLKSGDSIIIDQMSQEGEKYNWQATIKIKDDKCIVILLPPQISQDTIVLPDEKIIPLNTFIIKKSDLISILEKAKEELDQNKDMPDILATIDITQYLPTKKYFPKFKIKQFVVRKAESLYYIFRYNKLQSN
jgi:hypothetical protein